MRQELEMSLYNLEISEAKIPLRVYQIGDLENLSASALHYGEGGSPLGSLGAHGIVEKPMIEDAQRMKKNVSLPDIKIQPSRKIVIPLGDLELSNEGVKDVHDTYEVDRFLNLFKGHTSITGKKKKKGFYFDENF